MSKFKITYTGDEGEFYTIQEFPDMFDAFADAKLGLEVLKKEKVKATLKSVEEVSDDTDITDSG